MDANLFEFDGPPYFCRTLQNKSKETTLAAVYGSTFNFKDSKFDLDGFSVPGDTDRYGDANSMRVQYFFGNMHKPLCSNSKPIVWVSGSYKMNNDGLQGTGNHTSTFTEISSSCGKGHTESQFMKDFTTLMSNGNEGGSEVTTQPHTHDATATQIDSACIDEWREDMKGLEAMSHRYMYGFIIDSKFQPCHDCFEDLYEFATSKSLHTYLTGMEKPVYGKAMIIFRSRTLCSRDEACLHSGLKSYPMHYKHTDELCTLSLANKNVVYRGKLFPRFVFKLPGKLWFEGQEIDMPPILCMPANFCGRQNMLVGPFAYEF